MTKSELIAGVSKLITAYEDASGQTVGSTLMFHSEGSYKAFVYNGETFTEYKDAPESCATCGGKTEG